MRVSFDSEYDGSIDHILRLNDRYLFSYELIQGYLEYFCRSASVSYNVYWEHLLAGYLRRQVIQVEDLERLTNSRKHFQDAVVSYLILQEIPYESMTCSCLGENGVLFDGTSVAHQSLKSLLRQAWRVPSTTALPREQTPCEALVYLSGAPAEVKVLIPTRILEMY